MTIREAIESLIGYDKIWIYVGINSILCTHPDTRPTCLHLLYAWARARTCLSGTGEWIVPKVRVSVPWIPGGWENVRFRKVRGTLIWEEVSSNRECSGTKYSFNSKLVKNQMGVWLLNFTLVPTRQTKGFFWILRVEYSRSLARLTDAYLISRFMQARKHIASGCKWDA